MQLHKSTLLATMDSSTLREAIREVYPRVLAMAIQLLWSYPDACELAPEDLVHSAVQELLQKQQQNDLPACSAEQFLVRTIQSRIKDYVRNMRTRSRSTADIASLSPNVAAADTEIRPDRLARWLKVEALLDGGYPIVEVVEALLAGFYSKPDIAELIGCRTEEVENCMRRLRSKLRRLPDFATISASKHSRSAV